MKKSELGKFGEQVEFYEKARRDHPKVVFSYLKKKIQKKNPSILDLGCGTGISTRQLAKMRIGSVVGCDPDKIMLNRAKKHNMSGIKKYVRAYANKLPFSNDEFDVVTAFSAFHWFDDRKSLKEIKRVLKPEGLIFVSGHSGVKSWGEGYRKAIMKATGKPIDEFVKARGLDPVKVLGLSGFTDTEEKNWKKTETYSVKGAVEYVQSVSIWKSVPKNLRAVALEGLKKYFYMLYRRKGKIVRNLTVYTVVAKKDL